MWSKAFHPAGSSTQLCISGLVALMRSKDIQIKHLNRVLEQRVEERTHQLNEIRTHIIENSDSERMMLGLSVLHEIDASLVRMKLKCLELENKLNRRKLIKP